MRYDRLVQNGGHIGFFDSVMSTVTCMKSDDDKIHLFASSAK